MKYGIKSQEERNIDGKDGVLYEVILEADNGKSEVQKYFVASDEVAEDVLSNASINFNEGILAQEAKVESEVKPEVEMIEVSSAQIEKVNSKSLKNVIIK